MRGSMDEECDNICRLSCFVVSRVLTDWQVALLYVRTYPWAAHVMVRLLVSFDTSLHMLILFTMLLSMSDHDITFEGASEASLQRPLLRMCQTHGWQIVPSTAESLTNPASMLCRASLRQLSMRTYRRSQNPCKGR